MSAPVVTINRHVGVVERRARLAVRHLLASPGSATDALEVVTALGGALHATDPATPYLTVALRHERPDRDALETALLTERSAVRHHAMRRTLWIMDRATLGAAHRACTEAIATKEWARFSAMLLDNRIGDPDEWLRAARERALDVVADLGVCTARQLGTVAPELAIPLAVAPGKSYAATQGAHTRLMQNLGFDGAIVRTESVGSWISGEYRWVVSDRWLPDGITGATSDDLNDAARRLAASYLRAFGPATAADLQWWAGWPAGITRRALASVGAVAVTVDGPDGGTDTAWLLPDDLDPAPDVGPWATLLPSLDPTVMGWKQRHWYAGEHGRLGHTVFDRNGNAGHSIMADGVIVGTWAHRPDGSVVVRHLDRIGRTHASMIDRSVERYLAAVGDTIVRPRYPAPLQRELVDGSGPSS